MCLEMISSINIWVSWFLRSFYCLSLNNLASMQDDLPKYSSFNFFNILFFCLPVNPSSICHIPPDLALYWGAVALWLALITLPSLWKLTLHRNSRILPHILNAQRSFLGFWVTETGRAVCEAFFHDNQVLQNKEGLCFSGERFKVAKGQ